jgi:acyl-coenzyme A synthetase/AMP-(fatty) acid ligase
VAFVERLPRTLTGKINRAAVRASTDVGGTEIK